MRFFITIILTLSAYFISAQINLDFAIPIAPTFDITSTAFQSELGIKVKIDDESNVVTIGLFVGSYDFDPSTNSTYLMSSSSSVPALFIQKLSSSGNFIFAKKIELGSMPFQPGCNSGNQGTFQSISYLDDIEKFDLELGTNNEIYVSGLFVGTQDFDPGIGNSYLTSVCNSAISSNCCWKDKDQFILKLDSSGNFSWVRQVELSPEVLQGNPQYWNSFRNFYGIALDENNTLFVLSRVVNGTSCAGFGNNSQAVLMRFSSTGNCIGQTFMGNFFEVKNFTCKDGKIVFTGDYRPPSSQAVNMRMIVCDTIGNVQNTFDVNHQTTVGCGPTKFNIASHTVLENGDVVIAGDVTFDNCGNQNIDWDFGPSQYTTSGPGYHFNFVVSYKINGVLNWINIYPLINTSFTPKKAIHSIASDGFSNIYVLGEFSGNFDFNLGGGTANLISSDRDVFLLKIDSSANFNYVFGFNGTGAQYGNHLDVKNCDVAFVGTINQNAMNFSTTGNTTLLGPKTYLAKYSCCQIPINIDLANDTLDCLNNQITLSANQPNNTYSWYNNGVQISSLSSIIVNSPGTYTLNATNGSGCFGQDQVTIVADTVSPNLNYSLSDSILTCQNFLINGNVVSLPNSQISWSLNNQVISSSPDAQISNSGDLVISIIGMNGCNSSDTVQIVSNIQTPQLALGAEDSICAGGNLELIATGNGLVTWDPDLPNGSIVNPSSSQYYVANIVDSLGCQNTDSIFVNVIDSPILQVTSDTICQGEIANLSVVSSPGTAIFWENGEISPSISITTIEDSLISVYGELNGCYSDTLTASITVLPNLNIEIEVNGDSLICIGGVVNLTSSEQSGNIWSTGQNTQSITVTEPQIIVLTNTNLNGCGNQDSINILSSGFPCLEIVDVFSPNGDGINDNWEIPGIEAYPKAEVSIFNRWGQLLFFSIGYATPWNGKFNNEPLPIGDYFYIIDLGNGTKYNGSMTLKK